MTMRLIYECPTCNRRYECEAGCFARLDCEHKNATGEIVKWYPVKIIGWYVI